MILKIVIQHEFIVGGNGITMRYPTPTLIN
jgi:hypothetical protein